MPTHAGYGLGETMPPDELRAVVQYTRQHRTGDGGADAEAAIGGFLDGSHLGNFLDVDDQARPHGAGAHLHQKIGAAGHDARRASGGNKCLNRFIERAWA